MSETPQSLQLSVDAAAIVVSVADSDRERTVSRADIEAILRDQIVELTIIDVTAGSFNGRFSIDPRNEHGRRRLLAIAGLTAVTVGLIFPPAAIALTLVGVASGLNGLFTPDAVPTRQVTLKTVDPADMQQITADIRIHDTGEARVEPPLYVYDLDLDGPPESNEALLERVLTVPSVQRQSRFILGAQGGYPRIRIWSAEPLDSETLYRFAAESGTKITILSSQ